MERTKTDWIGIRIICQIGSTRLPSDCGFNELPLCKSSDVCWSSAEWTSLLSLWVKYWVIVCIRRLNNNLNRNWTLYYLFQFTFFDVIDTAPNKVMRDFTNNSQQCPIEIIISTKNVAIEGWRAVKFDKNIFCQFL